MNRSPVYKTPQFLLAMIGGWLILAGVVGGLVGGNDLTGSPLPSQTNQPTSIKVVPASGLPASGINQLQGAGGLQRQSSGSLQRSGIADHLQPNAKTDAFSETNEVQ